MRQIRPFLATIADRCIFSLEGTIPIYPNTLRGARLEEREVEEQAGG